MCGLVGLISNQNQENVLDNMIGVLDYRGTIIV